MADEIVTTYRVDVSKLQGDISKLVDVYGRADIAAQQSAQNASAEFKKADAIVMGLQQQVERLQKALAKATHPADIDRLTKALAQSSNALLKASEHADVLAKTTTRTAGILETMRARLLKLSDAREKAFDVKKIERFNALIKEQEKRITGLTGGMGDTEQKTNLVSGAMETLGKKILAVVALSKLIKQVGQGIEGFAASELKAEQLKFSITKLGDEGATALIKLKKQSDELKKVSWFGGGEISTAQKMLSQFGLTSEQIQKLIPGVLDLSVALDTDLTSATATVLSAFTGATRGLKEVNGDFQDTGTVAGNYNKVLEVMAGVQGAAAAAAKTHAGEMRQFANESDNLSKAIGEKLAPAWIGFKRIVNDVLQAITDTVKKSREIPGLSDERDSMLDALMKRKDDTPELLIAVKNLFIKDAKAIDDASKKLQNKTSKDIFPSLADSDELVRLANEYIKLTGWVQAYSIRIDELTKKREADAYAAEHNVKIESDLSKMSVAQLEKYITGLKDRTDARKTEVKTAIQLAEQQLIKTQQLEQKAIDDRRQAMEQLNALAESFAQQRLQAFAKHELETLAITRNIEIARAKIQFQKAGGRFDKQGNAVGDIGAVKAYNSTVESINAITDERIREHKEKTARETADFLTKIDDENLKNDLDATLHAIDVSGEMQIIGLKNLLAKKSKITKDDERKLADEILKIELEAEKTKYREKEKALRENFQRQRNKVRTSADNQIASETVAFNGSPDQSAAATQRFADRKVEIERAAQLAIEKINNDEQIAYEGMEREKTDVVVKESGKRADAAVDATKKVSDENLKLAETLQYVGDIMGALFDLQNSMYEARIQNMEYELDKQLEVFDAEQKAIEERVNNRLITEARAAKETDALAKKRADAEKKAQDQIKKEREKADKAKRASAIFEIGLNTAVGIINAWANPGYPAAIALTVLIAALGAAQMAAVLASPLPKYAGGVDYLRRKNGEPMGVDTIPILADEGERIIPRKQNIKHWRVYESLNDGTFDSYVNEKYILPALIAAKHKSGQLQNETFSNNIAKSMMNIGGSPADDQWQYEFKRLWRNGINVNNLNELNNEHKGRSIYTN